VDQDGQGHPPVPIKIYRENLRRRTLGRCGMNGRREERSKCANCIPNSRACCFGIGNYKGKEDKDPEKSPKPLWHRLAPRQVGAKLSKSGLYPKCRGRQSRSWTAASCGLVRTTGRRWERAGTARGCRMGYDEHLGRCSGLPVVRDLETTASGVQSATPKRHSTPAAFIVIGARWATSRARAGRMCSGCSATRSVRRR
jgi:hypothetical protein